MSDKAEKSGSSPIISANELRELALDLINSGSTMTLATCEQDTPWAAPVYYVYQGGLFFFFSKPDTRHIKEALVTGKASAAIHAYATSWEGIRGLQMSGIIKKSSVGLKSMNALKAYLKKYAFSKDFFKDGQKMDLEGFADRFKVNFYYFKPTLVYYIDNQIRFAFREEIVLYGVVEGRYLKGNTGEASNPKG